MRRWIPRTGDSSRNVHGRPEILDRPAGVPDLRFNLSHTDGLIACAVTIGREVGVDVEHVGRRLTHDIAGRFFAPREVADLKSLPVAEQPRVFFDYWTLKEAYIKARGFGLALPLGDFAFRPRAAGARRPSPSSRRCTTIRRRGSLRRRGRRRSTGWPSPIRRLRTATCRSASATSFRGA